MRISFEQASGCVIMRGEPSEKDIEYTGSRKAKQDRREACFKVPDDFSVEDCHPDLRALLALLVFGPFSARKIELSWSVSSSFCEISRTHFKRDIGPVDPTITPRGMPDGGADALAFSGGVDSVAALMLLPENTVSVFMNRLIPRGYPRGLYRADAALASCRDVAATERMVLVVDTDMEYVRQPPGFSVDWTNGAGPVLLADFLCLKSVSFGMIQESAFLLGHSHFSDLRNRSVYAAWAPLFEAVGLPISLPTSGLSEVVTSMIASFHAKDVRAQSCVRGFENNPCGSCFKCFRKKVLDAKLNGCLLSAEHFSKALTSREVKRRLLETPIHHENVLAYSLLDLKCDDNPTLLALREKTAPLVNYADGLSFLEKFNPRGLDYVPVHLRDHVHAKINRFAPDAGDDEIGRIESWETSGLTESLQYRLGQQALELVLQPGVRV